MVHYNSRPRLSSDLLIALDSERAHRTARAILPAPRSQATLDYFLLFTLDYGKRSGLRA
jgi:hypothetical protein